MGTRADFYVGKGTNAEWIGSIAFDGSRDGIDTQILQCTSDAAFRHAVADFLKSRDDATLPEHGWPWPWDDSSISDCSYWHFGGKTWESIADFRGGSGNKGDVYYPCDESEINYESDDYEERMKSLERIQFPSMKEKQKVTFGKRSGLLIISAR